MWPLVARAQQSVGAGYVRALEQAKRDYGKISKPSEAARSAYITRLVRLREQATRLKSETWQAIDAEIKEHPAPKDSDSKEWMRNLSGTSEGRVDIHRVLAEDVLRHGLTARRDSAI